MVAVPKYCHSALSYVIYCVEEKNCKIKIVSSISAIRLCFVINVLND